MRKRQFSGSISKAAQRGFSLIEIIVVVVLIGGIVAFAASRILGGGDPVSYTHLDVYKRQVFPPRTVSRW